MTKPLSTLVIGAGDRGNAWAHHAKASGAGLSIDAIAEPDDDKRQAYAEKHNISSQNIYDEGEEALNDGRDFDAVIIATPDKTHHAIAYQALRNNYNVLLEKPMATTEDDCIGIVEAQKKSGTVLSVAHVLRYSPFFQTLKDITNSGELGKLLQADLTEEIGHWHFAHSYVRGNWRNSEESSPVILAKSCHDLDILTWLADAQAGLVSSTGSLDFFNPDNKPDGATERCTDGCLVKKCIYDARQFYIGKHTIAKKSGEVRWPYAALSPETDPELRLHALKQSQYGECVFAGNNDVCDNQNVSIEFINGVRANFRLRSLGNMSNRQIRLYFERGELRGDLMKGKIERQTYHGDRDVNDVQEVTLKDMNAHGGGDGYLIKNFADMIRTGNTEGNKTSARQSLQSHLIAFAAEKSREIGEAIPVDSSL